MSMNSSGVPVRAVPDSAYFTEEPVSTGEWFWTQLVLAIPLVNLILMLVWAFGGGAKVSKRNYFRAALIWTAIGIGLSIISGIIFAAVGGSLLASLPSLTESLR